MLSRKHIRIPLLSCMMLFMILDSKNVIIGANEGVQICLKVIVPSLFPYLVLSNILTSSIRGKWAISAVGFLGGYPAGAQAIKTAYDLKQLTKEQAENMLSYNIQPGPAFIFGMLSQLFTQAYIPWVIWMIHLFTAFIISLLFNERKISPIQESKRTSICTLSESLNCSIKSMSSICGWVILFRIILQIINTRILHRASNIVTAIISGLLELSNGCIMLSSICDERLRFMICTAFLGLGGICVAMQTLSIVNGLKIRQYIIGKILQCLISTFLSIIVSGIIAN